MSTAQRERDSKAEGEAFEARIASERERAAMSERINTAARAWKEMYGEEGFTFIGITEWYNQPTWPFPES